MISQGNVVCVWGMVGSFVTCLLQIYCWVSWWNDFEIQLKFGEVINKSILSWLF